MQAMALMRIVYDLVERAKLDRNIVPVMDFVHDNMKRAQAVLRGGNDRLQGGLLVLLHPLGRGEGPREEAFSRD